MLKAFKEFIMRGNVIDMAVGIIIGTAFGKIVTSLVDDVIMPPIGFILGKVDFSNLAITLQQKTATSSGVVISYGAFINTVINFLIISFVIFFVIKQTNRLFVKKSVPTPTLKDCPYCFSSISINAKRCPHCTSSI